FLSSLIENTMGMKYLKNSPNNKLSFFCNTAATADGMLIDNKSLFRPNWQMELSLLYSPFKQVSVAINTGKKRVVFNFDHIRFLSDNYMNGNIYYWNDLNTDKVYQEGEKSDFFTTTGGKFHSLTNKIKQPGIFYFEIPVKLHFGKHSFVVHNIYKKFFNQWSAYMDGDSDSNGFYSIYDEEMIYFLNNGIANYTVDYFDSDFMNSTNNNTSWFFDSPFYAGNTFKYQYNGKKFFISASWTRYMIVGFGSFGNGVLHNNIDVLSESSSNPNLENNRIGRLDSDRSLVGRLFLSYKFSDRFSLAFQFKYKDGQSFTSNQTLINSDGHDNQIAVWYIRTKGDNPLTNEKGSRKDAFFNSILRLIYNGKMYKKYFSINLSMYNIFDFGTELAEYIYPPDYSTHRYVLELNIPRGIMASFSYKF
ncbi:MAG: hypothetical protein ABIJ97_09315, partial [Bacteroidota bacterium]